jgi:hypothetical protein
LTAEQLVIRCLRRPASLGCDELTLDRQPAAAQAAPQLRAAAGGQLVALATSAIGRARCRRAQR